MNVRLQVQTSFIAGVYYRDQLMMTNYYVDIDILTSSTDGEQQNVAMDRLKYMLDEVFSNCIFISDTEKLAIKRLQDAGIFTVALPEQPFDQIIGIMLYCKLQAVMEERLNIIELRLNSDLGNKVTYCHCDLESLGPFAKDGWWHKADLICEDFKERDAEKVVKIEKLLSWQDLNLGWESEDTNEQEKKIVYAKFNKDDKR